MAVRVRPKADIQLNFQFAWLPHGIDNQRLVVRDYAEPVESAAEIFNQGKDNISPMWPNEILCCLANSNPDESHQALKDAQSETPSGGGFNFRQLTSYF